MSINTMDCYMDDSVSMEVEPESIAPINILPVEILLRIFSNLQLKELSISAALTCREWNRLAFDPVVQFSVISTEFETLLPELDKKNSYIGPETLEQCVGEIGKAPPLTLEILKELQSSDPENEGKKKKDTHILALIPETINGRPLTLNTLNEFKNFRKYWPTIKEKYGDIRYLKTSWVLMTKDVLKGSRGKRRDELLDMALEHGEGYGAPTLLEAAFIITMLFVSKEIRLFSDDPKTFTCCLDKLPEWKLIVGGFDPSGLCVNYFDCDYNDVGVAALKRKF